MKAVFILFDSLNRNALSCYNKSALPTPAFDRLANRGVVFDSHYVGSLPCMPARRDLLTGRLNFLHRSWGPVEPFDICYPDLLRQNGIYSHLISDHYHYWEEGGCGYHNRYSSAEFVRGQERDLWKAMVQPPLERFKEQYHPMLSDSPRRAANMINREYIKQEEEFPIVQCVQLANEFLSHNHTADNWFLQVEMFDPHEPFTAPDRFRNSRSGYDGPVLDWPLYDQLNLADAEAMELRQNYEAVVQMCDHYLGKLLDTFDQYNLWKDTAIILTTDHGFLLGEHDWWGKNRMPVHDPIAHIPLLAYHPDSRPTTTPPAGAHAPDVQAQDQSPPHTEKRCTMLTQCLDLTATILDLYGLDYTASVTGTATATDADTEADPNAGNSTDTNADTATGKRKPMKVDGQSLLPALKNPQSGNYKLRDYALFGLFGGAVNITDGRYTYFHYPSDINSPLYEYTLMPVHPASYFTSDEFDGAELQQHTAFGNGYPLLKLKALDQARRPPMQGGAFGDARNVLYDLQTDPGQQHPLDDQTITAEMTNAISRLFDINNAPDELYKRFDLVR